MWYHLLVKVREFKVKVRPAGYGPRSRYRVISWTGITGKGGADGCSMYIPEENFEEFISQLKELLK